MGKIIATINPNTGHTEIKAEGFNGPECKLKTRPFEESLGKVVSDTDTPEMYNEETSAQTQNQS